MPNVSPYEHRTKLFTMRSYKSKAIPLECAPHLHRELELVYMIEGDTVGVADTVQTEIHAGDIFLTFPNQIHFYETHTTEKYYLLIFSPDLLPEFSETLSLSLPKSPLLQGADKNPEIKRLLAAIAEHEAIISPSSKSDPSAYSPYIQSLTRGYLLSLLSLLLPQMELEQVSLGDSGALRSIVSYCMTNFSENLSLSLLEERLHLNKYYISHLFSQKLGLRFNDYVNSLRISEACRYLLNSNNSITEISETVGFNTQRTFNRAFIKAMGMTPGEYRKNKSLTTQKQSERNSI